MLFSPQTPDKSPMLRRVLSWLAAALLGLQLLLANRISFEDLRFAMMAAVALVALVWMAPNRMRPAIGPLPLILCSLLLAFSLWRINGQPGSLWAALVGIPLALSVGLLMSGGKGLLLFWREGIVVLALALSPFVETVILELLGFDLAPTTTRFTAGLLRLCGWQASAQDVVLSLPSAWIVVSQGCSGLKTTYFLTAFAVVLLLVYPIRGLGRNAVILLGAAAIGYLVNSIRVAILALLASAGHEQAFQFWHVKQGAMIFEIGAVAVFLPLVYFLMPARNSIPAAPLGK